MLRDLFSLFPAYAGVIPIAEVALVTDWTFPRIRGGDPIDTPPQRYKAPFSPHTRG